MSYYKVVYYAKMDDGCILEDVEFRNVYNAVKYELRIQHGHSLYYDFGHATIYKGVVLEWTEQECLHCKYIPIRPIVTMYCSSIDYVTNFGIIKEG